MSWENAVRNHFAKVPLSFQRLKESIEKVLEGPEDFVSVQADDVLSSIAAGEYDSTTVASTEPEIPDGNKNLQAAVQTVTDLGYNFEISRKNLMKVKVPNEQRSEVMQKLRDVFEPLGYEYDSTRGGTHGMIKKLSRKDGSVFVVVKPEGSAGRAAQLGAEYEETLAKTINDKYSQYGISAKTAGFTHGSDLTIKGPNGTMTIETKTSSGADFGQFLLVYDISSERWAIAPTPSFEKNKELFTGLFKDYIEVYLNQFAKFPDISDPRIKAKKGFIYGLNPHVETGEYKKELAKIWFKDREDLRVAVDFFKIAGYYEKKGDKFIQIGGRGLYAFDADDADNLDIPMFSVLGKKATVRFRIKPKMGFNGHHSFTVAIKLTITKSDKDLTNEEDLESIIEKLL